ncbi:MAG TPA: DUF1540 domain-containing protein [Armatimonadota bacterium]|nr:DUF1540 domain-containing protein [Armatimonadota bacterium]HOS42779.1 DUF1540 domain-containing protein [Armatimonadota bacterium]
MEQLPPVTKCDVEECFYNRQTMCHAPAINVGGEHPNCDTFIPKGEHIMRSNTAMVGACHVDQCEYNQELTCHAAGIVVTHHLQHADCDTFEPRR